VTQFFRDGGEFEVWKNRSFRRFRGQSAGQQIRVWVLGCATGEEAYSIGILLREHMAKMDAPLQCRSLRPISMAGRWRRQGRTLPDQYRRRHVGGAPGALVRARGRYLLRGQGIAGDVHLLPDKRHQGRAVLQAGLVSAAISDLLNGSCKIASFRVSLRLAVERFLFLGNSENVTRHPKCFRRSIAGPHFPQAGDRHAAAPEFPIATAAHSTRSMRAVQPGVGSWAGAPRATDRERYAPAYVITTSISRSCISQGRPAAISSRPRAPPPLDCSASCTRDLRLELRAALGRALERNETVQAQQVQMGVNGYRSTWKSPSSRCRQAGRTAQLVVLFRTVVASRRRPAGRGNGLVQREHVDRLETELPAQRARAAGDESRSWDTNEELKSSNEDTVASTRKLPNRERGSLENLTRGVQSVTRS